MSFFDDAISALIKPARQFGPIVAQITISETHVDDCEITQHPVEAGANLTDHIIILPAQLIVRMGFTDYGLQSPSTYINEAISGGSVATPNSIALIYKQLLAMKGQRMPFTVVTGKRTYPNMVIKSLSTETDERTANSLIITARCQEIFFAQTQVVAVPPNSLHANPQASGSPIDYGTKLVTPAATTVTAP